MSRIVFVLCFYPFLGSVGGRCALVFVRFVCFLEGVPFASQRRDFPSIPFHVSLKATESMPVVVLLDLAISKGKEEERHATHRGLAAKNSVPQATVDHAQPWGQLSKKVT